jgi:hypothetical protein
MQNCSLFAVVNMLTVTGEGSAVAAAEAAAEVHTIWYNGCLFCVYRMVSSTPWQIVR